MDAGCNALVYFYVNASFGSETAWSYRHSDGGSYFYFNYQLFINLFDANDLTAGKYVVIL